MAFVGIKKLIKEDKEETKRNTSAIVAEQIKAGLLAGLGKKAYPEDWQDTTTGRVTTPKTTTTTTTAPKTTAGTKTKKTVTGTPRGTENLPEHYQPGQVRTLPLALQNKQAEPTNEQKKSMGDAWIDWLRETGTINDKGDVVRTKTGSIARKAYNQLQNNLQQFMKEQSATWGPWAERLNRDRVENPLTMYNNLPQSSRADWLKAPDAGVQDLLSIDNAMRFNDTNGINRNAITSSLNTYNKMLGRNQKVFDAQDNLREQLSSMLPEGRIRERLAHGAKVPFTERPDNYNDYAEDYDRELYDFIYGKGEHDKIMRIGSREQKQTLMSDLRDLWGLVDNGTLDRYDKLNKQITEGYKSEEEARIKAGYAQDKVDELRRTLQTVDDYEAFMRNYTDPLSNNYDPRIDKGGQDPHTSDEGLYTKSIDEIYSLINHGKEYDWLTSNGERMNIASSPQYQYATMMDAKERRIFSDYYEQGKVDEAKAFLDGLNATGILKSRYRPFEELTAQVNAAMLPVTSVIADQAGRTASEVMALPRTALSALGVESARDKDSWVFNPDRAVRDIESGIHRNVQEKYGEGAAQAVDVALNALSNIRRGLLTRGLGASGKLQEAETLFTFFMGVYEQEIARLLDENVGIEEASKQAAVTAGVEWLEELLPTHVMLGGEGKSLFTNWLKSTISEGMQEGFGASAGNTIETILTGEDERQKNLQNMYVEGFTNEDGKKVYPAMLGGQVGMNLAREQEQKDYLSGILRNTVAGAAGGGLGAAYGGIVNTANNINLGRAINSGTNTVDGKTGAAQLAALAKESNDKEIREAGEKLDKKITGGKKSPSNYAVGKLAGMLYQGTAERMQTVVQDTMVRSIRDQIMTGAQEAATRAGDAREAEQHEITQQEAQHYAEIIAKSVLTGKNPSNTELQELSKSEDAIQAWKSFNTRDRVADMAAEIRKEAAPMNSVMDTLGDLTSKVAKSRSAAAPDIDAAIKEAGGDTAAAIDNLQARRSDLISESFAGKMKDILKSDKGGKQSKNFLDDAVKIMLGAKTLAKTAPKTRLDSETAQKLFDAAREEFEAEDANRVLKQETVKPGEGKASFEDVEYGTKEWKQKVSGLSKTQRNQMGALGEIATRAGLKVTFINDAARSMINGYENNDGSIVINIAARNRSGLGHHMLTTMSHEMTHWLEQNSREGYAALRQYIVDGLRNSGTDVESRILQIMDNQNAVLSQYEGEESQGLSVNGAMAELVAQGCENLLSSETMMQELAEVNPSTFSKVKTFVANFVARIRNAVKGMSGSLSYEARTLIGQTEQIAKLWSSARAEALARNAEEGTEAQAGTQYSTQAQATEQAQEMDTEEYRQIAEQAGLDAPQMLRYSMVGPRAGGDYAEMIRQARQMEKQGEDAETIFRETGARKGFRGHWWVTLDNQNIRMRENFDTDSLSQYAYDLADVMDAEELMAAYPQLGKVKVQAQEMGRAYAAYVKDHNTIVLNEEELKRNPGKINVALRHEIQHVIQDIEGANGGANMRRWQDIISRNNMKEDPLDLYWRTAGELEANITSKDGGTMPTREQYDRAVAIEDYAPGLKGWKSRMEGRLNRHFSMADISAQDQEYAEAVASGNMKKATDMLMEKLKHSEDIIPYSAPHGYGGQHKTIARMIKEGTPEAVARAAQDLATYVPDNAVLVPMPPHEGTVTDDTDTMILARAIAQLTGRPVVNALASNPRESRYQAKSQGRKGLTAEEMGFRKIAELPEGTIPIFVDNVVGSGETAKAANLAMGGGVTLAYAKGTRTQGIRGLKEANVTYDKEGKLIPLSQRFNPDVRNVKYSTQDAAYMDAVERGDMEEAQRITDEAAKEAGYIKAGYHGTLNGGFTVFDKSYAGIGGNSGAGFYFSSNIADSESNYSDVEGADNWFKANHLADRILEEFRESDEEEFEYEGYTITEGMPYEDVVEIAKKILIKNPKTYHVYLNQGKAYIRDFNNSTNLVAEAIDNFDESLYNRDDYDNEDDYYDDVSMGRSDAIYEAISNAVYNGIADVDSNYEIYSNVNYEDIIGKLAEIAMDYESLTWNDITKVIEEQYIDIGTEDMDEPTDGSREIARAIVEAFGYDSIEDREVSKKFNQLKNMGNAGDTVHYIMFHPEQIKLADPVTYDNAGNIIPPSKRFNSKNNDIRYSTQEMTTEEYADGEGRTEVKQGEQPLNLMNDSGENVLTILPGNTVAATRYSLASYRDMDERGKMTKALKKAGYTQKEIDKWLKSLDSVANVIASNRAMYDFVADRSKKFLKDNGDVYKKTLDASTMCKKTRLYNGTFNVVQHMMPNTILMPEDLIDLFNIMKDLHLETPCGFCYVQSRRRQLGPYTEEWLKEYKGDYIPTVDEVTTSDGLEKLKVEHPQTYTDFVNAMNAKGVNNPKLVQQRTDYRGEIRKMRKSTIDYLNRIGGLRIQSFSDFEVVHMLDMMQAVMDMKAMGLTSQAYTKVPEFAWIFGNTGIKINLSLVGKGTGLDANGKLVFDNDEGMPYAEAMRLRKAYSKNVGTILVGINDEHIIAAMGDDTIDFIIPFHKSGWSANELAHMRGLEHYSDYTESQNEYDIKGIDAAGNLIKVKADSNMDPLDYWEFDKDGEYNARKYLRLCKENHIVPKFAQFLTDNKDGSFSLPEGNDKKSVNIRKGYWKTLIDFKMYDNEGNGSRQEKVEPNFNMDEAMKILEQYDGSHRELPESWEAAEEFVKRYKAAHPLDNVRVRYSTQESFSVQSPYDMDVNNFMMGLQETQLDTLQEKTMLRQYKDLKTSLDVQRLKIDERTKELRKLEAKKDPNAKDRNDMIRLRNMLDTDMKKHDRLEEQIIKVTSSEGYAGLMFRQHRVMMDLANGKTADEVKRTISGIQSSIEGLDRQISEREAEIREMADSTPVKAIQAMINDKDLDRLAAYLRKTYNSKTSKQEIMQDMAAIRLKMANRQKVDDDIEALTRKLIGGVRGEGSVYLDLLRGMTITLSRDQVKELAGKDSGIAEVRRMLAGSGIKVKQGKAGGSLDANWSELCDMIPALNRDTGEKDQIDELIRFVQSQLQSTSGAAMYQDQLEDAMTEVRAITASVGMDMAQDPAAVRVVQRMMNLMAEMQRGMKGSAAELKKAREQLAEMSRQGAMAGRLSGDMEHNINSTIEYLNKLSEQSEAARWRKERVRLIEQLKSETTEKLLQEQAKWKARIEKDKTVRGMMNENLSLRKKINTNVNRVQKLLINETDQKNVPEHLKGLARLMVMKVLTNDLGGGRKITGMDPEIMAEKMRVLRLQEQRDGSFDFTDLDMVRDPEVKQVVADALADIEDGIAFYNARGGKDIIANLQGMKNALTRISEAVSNITSIISAERHINFRDRQIAIEDAAEDVMEGYKESRFKGEWKGFGSKAINAVKKSIGYGNVTPVYYMKNLRNRGMMDHWREMEYGEHKSGLLLAQAKAWMNQLAEKTHYKDWADDKITVQAADRTMTMDVQSAMSILAIWKREHTGTNPENSSHIENGGIHLKEKDETTGRLQREKKLHKAIRLGDSDIAAIRAALTDEQLEYMDKVVGYLSHEMSELGNETSMRMYGIKKFKEDYYFPMKTWSAQLSEKSDAGAGAGMDDNRAAHKSWSKRRTYYARTALEIGNFTEEAVRHITEMINYNTMAPVIENLNKTLNYQVEDEDGIKRNLWERFEEAYGKEARDYLKTLLKDMNGGAVQDQRKSLRDRALSMFKKNAVAGSLSVAAQQPLSYVRAAMMLSPRDLAQAIMPQYWKGSWAEMMKHSGVAVIKEMGRFDMNFGQSARDFVSPDTSESLPERVVDKLNILPTLADRMTWTRMWSACKIEQHRLHPEMDMQSDAFLDLVGERFNDVMRRTQVYDSVLVKSSNMRSPNLGMKVLTSFMAEPTVSLNVLEDAVRNARDKGGMKLVGKAVTTFALSAVLQALIKGFMSAGRSPDDKKTAEENFLYKWQTAFMSEANPLGLIPGYSDLIEVLKNGELTDDAMSAVGKLKTVIDKAGKALSGQGQGVYRDLEDTAGQLAQMFTNVPAKNIMRDMRAMLTWFRQGSLIGAKDFASRESSDAVKRMQAEAAMYQGDNLRGVINTWLGEAGYKTTNKAYYGRMYQAMQAGNDQEAADIREYLMLGKGVKEDAIDSGLRSQAKADSSLGEAERSEWLIDQGLMSGTNTITSQLKEGKISADEARKLMKQADPEMSTDDIWWKVDQISWQKETGAEKTPGGKNYRLMQAVAGNKSEEITKAVKEMMAHGVTQKQIKDYMGDLKQEYLAADSKGKVRIRDAIQKVYKAIGLTAAEADKRIKAWKPAKENTTSTKKTESSQDTTGQWGRGNINLNKRKVIHNNDGTISTEESFSTNIDGKEVLLPTIIDGKRVSEEKAIQHYMQTGEYLGKFDTVKEAEEYAQKLHERQDWYYHNH